MDNYTLACALLPDAYEVLRFPLRPLSVGHVLNLERIRSPFITGVGEPLLSDLMEAVLICVNTFESVRKLKHDDKLGKKLINWTEKLDGLDIPTEMQRFYDYIAAGSITPEIRPSGEPTRPPGAPWLLRLVHFLQFNLGLTRKEAWNYPFGLAQIEFATYFESRGMLQIKNDDEAAFDAWCDEQDRLEAERGKRGL